MMGDETAYRGFVIDQLMQFEQAYAETLAGFEASRMTSKALTLPLLPLLTPLPLLPMLPLCAAELPLWRLRAYLGLV